MPRPSDPPAPPPPLGGGRGGDSWDAMRPPVPFEDSDGYLYRVEGDPLTYIGRLTRVRGHPAVRCQKHSAGRSNCSWLESTNSGVPVALMKQWCAAGAVDMCHEQMDHLRLKYRFKDFYLRGRGASGQDSIKPPTLQFLS